MKDSVVASIALLASTALAQGTATVVNMCDYDVHLSNTPASGGGHEADNTMLASGGSYSQVYTELTNGNGWSIKLSKDGNYASNLLQYEYTYHPGEPIWYDLSEVDGNPWDGNWEITATGDCSPRQAAYRYATDDAYGMQSCPADASITVTICSGTGHGGDPSAPSSPAESAPPAASTPAYSAPAPSVPVPTYTEAPAPEETWGGWPPAAKNVEDSADGDVEEKKLPADGWNGPAVTVTNLHYATVTEYVTASPNKRHVHHPRHPHHGRR